MGRRPSPESVPSWSFSSWVPSCPPLTPGLAQTGSEGVRLQSVGFRLHGSGKFSPELAGGGSLERGPGKPVSGAETRLPCRWMKVPGVWAVGAYWPSALQSCGQVSEQSRDTSITTRLNPRPFWENVAWQEAGTSKEGICKSVWGRTFPHGLVQCGHWPGLLAFG